MSRTCDVWVILNSSNQTGKLTWIIHSKQFPTLQVPKTWILPHITSKFWHYHYTCNFMYNKGFHTKFIRMFVMRLWSKVHMPSWNGKLVSMIDVITFQVATTSVLIFQTKREEWRSRKLQIFQLPQTPLMFRTLLKLTCKLTDLVFSEGLYTGW